MRSTHICPFLFLYRIFFFPSVYNLSMKMMTLDGNGAVAYISYAFSSLAIIYPITPSSPMAELADTWSSQEKPNLFDEVPKVVQMQAESGAAGALHGALTCGALATTYTCSQGLLLMLPDMYKIAGELLPVVIHVTSRALSTHALSIFGDHQDVMAVRGCGFAMLCSSSVQEAHDFALLSHIVTLRASVPFLHFFDGFRTSHEVNKIEGLDYEELRSLLPKEGIERFRRRALSPDSPIQQGTAQNPDIYFQNREGANARYLALPANLQTAMDELFTLTGRQYHPFDYFGHENAERVLVLMGSGCSAAQETVELLAEQGERVGLVKVRLYRPFDGKTFCRTLPKSCQTLAALDRTKEAGSLGEPLYLDICAAVQESGTPVRVYGGRYGLGGKEFTPADAYAALENLAQKEPKNHFTLGIRDDKTHLSLDPVPLSLKKRGTSCIFYGLGSDGTVGANKNSIKIIGERTPLYVQGFFCYDSRKSGGVTVSHLRFGEPPILSSYLIDKADFIACHNPSYLERYDMLSKLKEGGQVLLNCPWGSLDELEQELPAPFKRQLAQKNARLFVIDGASIAREAGLTGRISTVMQAAFFYLHQDLLPYDKAKGYLLEEIEGKFQKKGIEVVRMNARCVEEAEKGIRKIFYPAAWRDTNAGAPTLARSKDPYFQDFILPILSLQGDTLPLSVFPDDGRVPTATSKLEKHGAPPSIPKWLPENCIQCNQCALVCPHACIRPFLFPKEGAPNFTTIPAVGVKEGVFRIQVSPHDCMGCGVCARTCPAPQKALVMTDTAPLLSAEGKAWEEAQSAPVLPSPFKRSTVKGSQFYPPLFEFSYACAGCGETPYIKLLTQLFGERLLIANATGCSSIYGGSAPTCPYAVNREGKGPAWASSLFEDNAEFGYGMRLALETAKKAGTSVWCIGGDGWAYDIGYGGLDHVLSTGANINILVLDSEVYSNTGGQASKATPLGAVARFASSGKRSQKKNLGLMAMTYKNVYVAQVCMGGNMAQTVAAFTEAEAYEGPSLIIAYSPCIEHGVYLGKCMEEEKLAVECGYWGLYRYNPALQEGERFRLDSKAPIRPLKEFLTGENRFAQLFRKEPTLANELLKGAEKEIAEKFALYEKLSRNLEL